LLSPDGLPQQSKSIPLDFKQVTGDSGQGALMGDFKGQVFAVGPQLKYDYRNMAFSVKYQREMLVENKPEGNKFWLNLMYAF
jgi:hypothetical protein